ncbi:MAG: AAA family ATPase [Okeania sp. SIO3B5]|uniref:AAA-like domain-containing protein n=1 Tax=Okeania sp. SIO3B5 TaxID=2607811 RepID=UPI0013FF1985|nr:AAA-like domain-containing protein [Okeania sp. SIO3B5]NEO53471.1 AAA family ATPase [Okeania sp. SIO3B5]
MILSANRKNPYIIGRPIYEKELFFGRDNLFKYIGANLNNGAKAILLQGQRRIGKSSVLHQIPNGVKGDNFVFVYFDLQDKANLTLAEVLEKLAIEIIRKLELKQDNIKQPLKTNLEANTKIFSQNFLPQVFQNLGDKNLVLLLDEFDVLSDYNPASAIKHFFPYLQSIISNHQQLFIIPVVGRRLDEMEYLLNLFRRAPNQEIGLLDEKSATQLITKPAEGVLEYGEDAIAAILELSAGHPYFTQVICFQIFQQAEAENNWQVTSVDVDKMIVDRAIESAEGGLTWFRDGLPIPERAIFSAVAEAQRIAAIKPTQVVKDPLTVLKEYGVVLKESLSQAADRLVEWGFLDLAESSDLAWDKVPRYKVKIELVRRWLLKRYSLRGEIYELENLSSEANRIYKLATDLQQELVPPTSVIALYEQVLKINPNHFKALFDLAEAYLVVEDFSKAVEFYQRGYDVNQVRAEDGLVKSLLGYGQNLMEQRKWKTAKEEFEEVLNIEPDNTLAKNRLREIEQILEIKKDPPIDRPVPPERFVGRDNLIAIAFDQIRSHSNLAIWGGPGMGKTYFLNLLTSHQVWQSRETDPSRAIIVYLNCLEILPFMPASFWRRIIDLIREKTEGNAVLQQITRQLLNKPKLTKDDLSLVLNKTGKQNKFLVLLLDNYDATFRSNSQYTETDIEVFLSECRNLAYHSLEGRYLSMIVTSSQRLNETGPSLTQEKSPWYNHYAFQQLKPLNQNEVDSLLNEIEIIPETREGIEEISGGNPALLKNAKLILHNKICSGETISAEVFARDFIKATGHFFRRTWQLFNKLEQTLLMLIALSKLSYRVQNKLYNLGDISIIFSQKERELIDLQQRGIIKRTAEQKNTGYLFYSTIMEWWVIREIENYNPETFKQMEKIFLNLMSHQQAEKVINVIKYLSENKEATKSIVKWVSKLAKCFA